MQQIAILGYGQEGRAVEDYFRRRRVKTQVFDNFTPEELETLDLEDFSLVFRSPSVPPLKGRDWQSSTKYFFAHCPCPIIGVTGTKGKGTTCSMIAAILNSAFSEGIYPPSTGNQPTSPMTPSAIPASRPTRRPRVHLVGNIGVPAISVLDDIMPEDAVIYELSSFQLWDIHQSPHIAVVLRIEADHLDIHHGFLDYTNAKSNIARFQSLDDVCIYFADNPESARIGRLSMGSQLKYSHTERPEATPIIDNLRVPGAHNREDAEAALLASANLLFPGKPVEQQLRLIAEPAKKALAEFRPLPHHLEVVRSLTGVTYYDDSFSASYPSMDVAISALAPTPTILIAGGKDRHLDLTEARDRIFSAPSIVKALLIGETAPLLARGQDQAKYEIMPNLEEAVHRARYLAEAEYSHTNQPVAVLLSPGAASKDMFRNFIERGETFKRLVKELK